MIPMAVNRPLREEYRRLFRVQYLAHTFVLRRVYLSITIYLPSEDRPCLQNGAGLSRLSRANCSSLTRQFPINAGFSRSQIDNHHFMAQV